MFAELTWTGPVGVAMVRRTSPPVDTEAALAVHLLDSHRFGRLLSANGLSRRSTIYPGQTLLIPD